MNIKWLLLANQVEAKLAQMKLQGHSQAAAMGAVGASIANRVRLGFRLGRSPYGQPWAPLNPFFRVGQPLRDTGRLQRSITHQVQGGDSVAVGTNVRYARTHQHGADIKPVNAKMLGPIGSAGGGAVFLKGAKIPARPFMPLQGDQVVLPEPWARSALAALAKSMGLNE